MLWTFLEARAKSRLDLCSWDPSTIAFISSFKKCYIINTLAQRMILFEKTQISTTLEQKSNSEELDSECEVLEILSQLNFVYIYHFMFVKMIYDRSKSTICDAKKKTQRTHRHVLPWVLRSLACLPSYLHLSEASYVCLCPDFQLYLVRVTGKCTSTSSSQKQNSSNELLDIDLISCYLTKVTCQSLEFFVNSLGFSTQFHFLHSNQHAFRKF